MSRIAGHYQKVGTRQEGIYPDFTEEQEAPGQQSGRKGSTQTLQRSKEAPGQQSGSTDRKQNRKKSLPDAVSEE